MKPISSADQRAAVTPAVFQGSGEDALLALEALVAQHVVTKPRLTLMQLQRAVQGISCLESPCQLAAIGVLVRGGFWLAAMQVGQTSDCRHCSAPCHAFSFAHLERFRCKVIYSAMGSMACMACDHSCMHLCPRVHGLVYPALRQLSQPSQPRS